MERHFRPDSIPEFLYPAKESEKNHNIKYMDRILIEELKIKYSDWFDIEDEISDFADSAGSSDLRLITFALVPLKKTGYSAHWNSLLSIIDKKGKESGNPCFFINKQVPGILLEGSSVENIKELGQSVLNKFEDEFKTDSKSQAICGISYLPCLEYTPDNLISNSMKALVHASMLPQDKIAVFDSVSLNVSSDEFFQKKDIDNAIKELELAISLNDKDTNSLNSLGVCFAVKKDFEKAAYYFEKATNQTHDFIMPMYNLGLVYYLNNKKENAKEIFLRTLEKSREHFEIPFYLGKIEYDLGNFEKALELFLNAEKIRPGNAAILNFIGSIHMKQENLDQAFLYYKRALKIFPQNAYALSAIGFIYFKKGENPEIAEAFMKQSTEIEPANTLFRERLNLILKGKKEENSYKDRKRAHLREAL